ncbi:MAG: hypothetical protein DCC67_04525 [Planctomycetota bacterium]|nr:MAG: hypothetical protein DCC67_04525 [Planctomycetota bacterium]
MSIAETTQSPPSQGGRGLAVVLGVVLVALAAAAAYWFLGGGGGSSAAEGEAAKQLESLGALVVKDGGQSYVASVNLSTIGSAESLAKAVELLPALARLGSLDASRTAITDQQLATIGRLGSLTTLTLSETGVSDQGVNSLRSLDNLQSLSLSSTGVSDAAFFDLADLRELRVLDLANTKVSRDLAPLAQLPRLEWLVLRGLTLADDALSQLAACDSLQRLSLEESKYSPESLTALEQKMPSLKVDR